MSNLTTSEDADPERSAELVTVVTTDTIPSSTPGPTLLPASLASAVSLATRSTSFAIRVGTVVGTYGLDAARFTTLSSLELARGMVEGALIRARDDPAYASRSDFANASADSILERSLENVHYAMTQAVCWTAAGFQLTGITVSASAGASQMVMSMLDKLLGSTDSSRAIATIIALIRREFRHPTTGQSGQGVGVTDLVLAFGALAWLQQWCLKMPEEQRRRKECEEVIWDVVVLNDGERVDVQDPAAATDEPPLLPPRPIQDLALPNPEDGTTIAQIKDSILASLAPGSTVSIAATTSTVQTVTVDIDSPGSLHIPTPPGARILDTRTTVASDGATDGRSQTTVVYEIGHNANQRMSCHYQIAAPNELLIRSIEPPQEQLAGDPDIDMSSPESTPPNEKSYVELPPRTVPNNGNTRPATMFKKIKVAGQTISNILQTSPTLTPRSHTLSPRTENAPNKLRRTRSTGSNDGNRLRRKPTSPNLPAKPLLQAAVPIQNQGIKRQRDSPSASQMELSSANPLILRRSSSQTSLRKELPPTPHLPPVPPKSQGSLYPPRESPRGHRRSGSHASSMYSFRSDSQTSLMLASYHLKSAYGTSDAIDTLRREGFVDGTFPAGHLLSNITRYMRFSSASYGSNFLKMTGLSSGMPAMRPEDEQHADIRHFLHHTESEAGSVLLASLVEPPNDADSSTSAGTNPLVHYVSLDHGAKAVVLACRGTLGFEDILADLTCDYDDLVWRNKSFRVHKGIHASADRLLHGGDGRVFMTLREALREFPDYGLVLTGHSLGAGVAALLGVMLSEPNPRGVGFVTSSKPVKRTTRTDDGTTSQIPVGGLLPPGRRIHVYAYGPPGVMSPSLCKYTKGLITTIIHGHDVVPYLSLGLLHDFQAVALEFKSDNNEAKTELRKRLWALIQNNLPTNWYNNTFTDASSTDLILHRQADEEWMLPALASLRRNMTSEKMMPPGEVFTVESQKVLRRDAFLMAREEEDHFGRPAQRVVLKYVKDVAARFNEVRFGASMLTDHTPYRYEETLKRLKMGVA